MRSPTSLGALLALPALLLLAPLPAAAQSTPPQLDDATGNP